MIAAFNEVVAGIAVLKKCLVCLFLALSLMGCGYKGALYIPPERAQSAEPEETPAEEDTQQSPASTSGDSK